jgi:hypothetical protein
MDRPNFTKSLEQDAPPGTSVYLKALWYDRKNQWKNAHELIDHLGDPKACWVHAYLHRKEGDLSNADYWYSRAGKKRPQFSLDEEWEQLVNVFLQES